MDSITKTIYKFIQCIDGGFKSAQELFTYRNVLETYRMCGTCVKNNVITETMQKNKQCGCKYGEYLSRVNYQRIVNIGSQKIHFNFEIPAELSVELGEGNIELSKIDLELLNTFDLNNMMDLVKNIYVESLLKHNALCQVDDLKYKLLYNNTPTFIHQYINNQKLVYAELYKFIIDEISHMQLMEKSDCSNNISLIEL